MDAAVKKQTAWMPEANRQRNSIESAVDVPSPGIYTAQSFSMVKQQTLAEEQSAQATASECFHLVKTMMSMCESYLRDNADFKGFILWALVDNNGRFEQPDGIEKYGGMERNDESYDSMNFEQLDGMEESERTEMIDESYNHMNFEEPGRIEESGGMERNDKSYNCLNFEQLDGMEESERTERIDESYNYMNFEEPGRIEESGDIERNDKSYDSLNAFHKAGQATSFYKVKGNEEAVGAQNGKAARLVHIKRAKVVRPVHAKRTYRASHTRQSSSAQTTSSARCLRQWSHCGRRAAQSCVRTWRPWKA